MAARGSGSSQTAFRSMRPSATSTRRPSIGASARSACACSGRSAPSTASAGCRCGYRAIQVTAKCEEAQLGFEHARYELDLRLAQFVARAHRIEQLENRGASEPIRILRHCIERLEARRYVPLETLQSLLPQGD